VLYHELAVACVWQTSQLYLCIFHAEECHMTVWMWIRFWFTGECADRQQGADMSTYVTSSRPPIIPIVRRLHRRNTVAQSAVTATTNDQKSRHCSCIILNINCRHKNMFISKFRWQHCSSPWGHLISSLYSKRRVKSPTKIWNTNFPNYFFFNTLWLHAHLLQLLLTKLRALKCT
jgi:hypothetical protein